MFKHYLRLLAVVLCGALTACSTLREPARPVSDNGKEAKREVRGAWIQTAFQGEYKEMTPARMKKDFIRKLDYLKRCGINAIIFQVRPEADAWADGISTSEEGVSFTLHMDGWQREVTLPFPGTFSVSNALAAALCAHLLGIGPDAIALGLSRTRVPGRMEFYRSEDRQLTAIVDYAHNRLAFEALLSAVSSTFEGAQVISVFGAVGGKAEERRRDLPEIAARFSDYIVLTSDDPWTEDPLDICHEMERALPEGFPHEIVVDREKAAERAFELAEGRKSVVLLLAKGHEAYQHNRDGFVPCVSDCELARRGVAAHDEKGRA